MKNKTKIILIAGIGIVLIALLIIFNNPKFLTTVFSLQNSTGADINPPQTLEDCHQIGGLTVPLDQECPKYFIEFGNSGTDAICCVADTCQGKWVRVFNQDLNAFQRVCQNI